MSKEPVQRAKAVKFRKREGGRELSFEMVQNMFLSIEICKSELVLFPFVGFSDIVCLRIENKPVCQILYSVLTYKSNLGVNIAIILSYSFRQIITESSLQPQYFAPARIQTTKQIIKNNWIPNPCHISTFIQNSQNYGRAGNLFLAFSAADDQSTGLASAAGHGGLRATSLRV